MSNTFWTIFRKEWLASWRDQRSFWLNVLMSVVFFPMLMLAPMFFLLQNTMEDLASFLSVPVQGLEHAPSLQTFALQETTLFIALVEVDDVSEALRAREYAIGIIVPPDFESRMSTLQPASLEVLTLQGQQMLETNQTRLSRFLSLYSDYLIRERLLERGQPDALLQTFEVQTVSIAPKEGSLQRSYAGWMFYFITVTYIFGLTTVKAVDVSTSEKEKQTIESLLLTPAHRVGIFLGKMVYVLTHSLLFVGLTALSVLLAFVGALFALRDLVLNAVSLAGAESTRVSADMEFIPQQFLGVALWLVVLVVLLMFFFLSLQLTVGYWARSESQANTVLGVGNLFLIVFGFVLFIPAYQPPLWHYAMPFLNAVLLFSDLIAGNINHAAIAVAVASKIVLIGSLSLLNVWMLNREEIVFRT
jgi:sodium transport system permease protein